MSLLWPYVKFKCLFHFFPGQAKSVSRVVDAFKAMWTENGDHLARIYAGTGTYFKIVELVSSSKAIVRLTSRITEVFVL